jgi:hypothetical protein
MSDTVTLSLDFRLMNPNRYKELNEALKPLSYSSATVYRGKAAVIRNKLCVLQEKPWFKEHISLAKIIIDDKEYNVIDKLDLFDKLVVYFGDVDTKETLKKLIS